MKPTTQPPSSLRKFPWGVLVKCLVSGGLIFWLSTKIDILQVWQIIQGLHGGILALVLLLLWATCAGIAKRWQLVVRLTDKTVPLSGLVKATFIGVFFNQLLPSSVGGDFFRILAVRRHGISLNEAVTGVIVDRVFGFLSLGILCLLAIPAEGQILLNSDLKWPFLLTLLLLGGVMGGGIILLLIPTRWLHYPLTRPLIPLTEMIQRMSSHKALVASILINSLVTSLLLISGLQVLMMAFDIPLTWGQGAAILPAVLLLASLPISFAGWGLREGTMIVALGVYGVPPETALALSLVYGMLHLASAIPGLGLWILEKRFTVP